jgi:hypothetical protein
MKKGSHNTAGDATGAGIPEQVSVAMAEVAGNMQEGLLALAVGAGLQVMQQLMDADVTALAGPKGRHDPARAAVRHGREDGSVTLGGRRVPVTRPRARAAVGSGELAIASYELFSSAEVLGRMAMEQMLAGQDLQAVHPDPRREDKAGAGAIATVYLAAQATAAGARLPACRVELKTVFTGRRPRTAPTTAHPHASFVHAGVMCTLAAIFLAAGGWGFRDGGPRICACAPPGYVMNYND